LTATSFFEQILANDRKLELDYEYACDGQPESARRVRATTAAYLQAYASFNNISAEMAIASYTRTVRRYSGDIRAFIESGKYPLEINSDQYELSRCDYDLFLILSILATKHRCALMEELTKFPAKGRALVVGVGSGVELSFVGAPDGGDAYDLYINGFARTAYPSWQFREELFRASRPRYGAVYAIELLEHLDQPYAFMADCRESLVLNGRLVVTTATNVPQFDHRVNFDSDDEFEKRAVALGLRLEHKRVVPHAYPRTHIGARNGFYVFRKTV
jgi:hypothetical protein